MSPSVNKNNLFSVLELKILSTATECKKNIYRRSARKYHPDKWINTKSFSKIEGIEIFENISNVYEDICILKKYFNLYMLDLCFISGDLFGQ